MDSHRNPSQTLSESAYQGIATAVDDVGSTGAPTRTALFVLLATLVTLVILYVIITQQPPPRFMAPGFPGRPMRAL